MSIAPHFPSACKLATDLPDMIARFIDLEIQLRRRFREDTITDIIIGSLVQLPGNDVVVLTPPEIVTGGDFDILIVDSSTGHNIQFRLQAKRLHPHKTRWERVVIESSPIR